MSNINDKAPTGATHCYFHGSDADWYCYTDRGLYRWCQGSWCASVHKTIEELASSCPLGRLEAIPAEPAQPVEDDLTWLARNVHGWHDNGDLVAYKWCGCAHFIFQNQPTPSGCETFTKAQWLTRRAELQNKPSWDDFRESAKFMAQDSDGAWRAFESEPTAQSLIWNTKRGWRGYAYEDTADNRGEVLGDWRDTLEQRPVSSGISGSEAAAGLKSFTVKATDTIDWSTAPAEATHHISGNNLEFSWHKNSSRIRYWNGFVWIKRSGFHSIDEARAKGFTVVARPADLSDVASSAASVAAATDRLTEATQNVLAAVPALMDEKYSFEPEFNPVTVTNETVQLEQPVAVAGTGISIVEWAAKHRDDIERKAQEAADLSLRVSTLLRENPGLFSANELADLHQLCDAELTKRDAAVCGGQKYLDAHWFERGELPPVGAVCEFIRSGFKDWKRCEILFMGKVSLVMNTDKVSEQRFALHDIKFRPIRTERDELVGIIKEDPLRSDTEIADAILAAGFKRGEA